MPVATLEAIVASRESGLVERDGRFVAAVVPAGSPAYESLAAARDAEPSSAMPMREFARGPRAALEELDTSGPTTITRNGESLVVLAAVDPSDGKLVSARAGGGEAALVPNGQGLAPEIQSPTPTQPARHPERGSGTEGRSTEELSDAVTARLFEPGVSKGVWLPGYVYSAGLIDAVNLALALGRPLLVLGAPGSGKSSLAADVALVLGWAYQEARLTSHSPPRDLLWRVDDLHRRSDAQAGRLRDPGSCIRRGVIWEAFEGQSRTVLLLDDVDRADSVVDDLLLSVLGRLEFVVDETGEVVRARGDARPLVIVTTSGERKIDGRFSRRCVEVAIPEPSLEMLVEIARAHSLDDDLARTQVTAQQFCMAQREAHERGVAAPGVNDFVDVLTRLSQLDAAELAPNAGNPFLALLGHQPELAPHAGGMLGDPMSPGASERAGHQTPSIFLCHSSGDKPRVRELYRRLTADGLKPWLDEEDILPGKDWQREIARAVREADLVVVCLSSDSIEKRGYVQREIKDVLDVADEMPDGRVFVVPARLEACEVPERLRRWQWVNLYEPHGYDLLLKTANSIALLGS